MNPRRVLLSPLVLLAAGCEAPRWRAEVAPADAALLVDGVLRPDAPIDEPLPYYGTVELLGVPAPPNSERLAAERALFPLEPPVTPWLFPFDFAVELLRAAFVEDEVPVARLELAPRPPAPPPGQLPPALPAFEARARRAAGLR